MRGPCKPERRLNKTSDAHPQNDSEHLQRGEAPINGASRKDLPRF